MKIDSKNCASRWSLTNFTLNLYYNILIRFSLKKILLTGEKVERFEAHFLLFYQGMLCDHLVPGDCTVSENVEILAHK
jgi:hypothetical protein